MYHGIRLIIYGFPYGENFRLHFISKNHNIFKSHNFNVQNHSQTIAIEDILAVGGLNTLGIVPNGLTLTTNDRIEK